MNCSYVRPPDVHIFHQKKFTKTFSWYLNVGKLKTKQKLIFLPCLYSPPYLFWRKVGTQSHSTKFLNWGDHINSVPDLSVSPTPLTRGIYFLIYVPNYRKINGLDLEKITSCQNVFNLHASFQSSPKINCMLITRPTWICCGSILSLVQIFFSFVLGMVMYDNNVIMSLKQKKKRKFEPRIKLNHNTYIESHQGSYPYFPWSPLGTPRTPPFCSGPTRKKQLHFRVWLS